MVGRIGENEMLTWALSWFLKSVLEKEDAKGDGCSIWLFYLTTVVGDVLLVYIVACVLGGFKPF